MSNTAHPSPEEGAMALEIKIEHVWPDDIPNVARFAQYIGVVSQINGSLIQSVTVTGNGGGPEQTSPDGRALLLGANHLPPMYSAAPSAVAAWCGAALHGFAHSRYSPRTDEPLRHTLQKNGLHRTWNMIEDARIERLLLAEFPGWQPHLMGAVAHILLRSDIKDRRGKRLNLSSVYPLLVGRTYLPAELRQESYEAFAEDHSNYIADAVRDLIFRYMRLLDPGSADHDETVEIVQRLASLLGKDAGTECGSHSVDEEVERQWVDPGDPAEDDDESDSDEGDESGDGNHVVTDEDDDESEGDEGDSLPTDEGGDEGDESEGGESGSDGDGDGDGESEGDDADDGDGSGEGDDDDEGEGDTDGGTGHADDDDDDDDDGGDLSDSGSNGEGGGGSTASRLVDWVNSMNAALAADERLGELREAITQGPMPEVTLKTREVRSVEVPSSMRMAEHEIARELRVVMDGARPGMRRRVDRGRFNVARVVREGGMTRPEEMFDRHDPGALRAMGVAVAVLSDVSGSLSSEQLVGSMASLWAIDRAVESVRGSFKAWVFGSGAYEMERSTDAGMPMVLRKDGSTQPLLAAAAAHAWFSKRREPNKLCIIVTDGSWDGNIETHNILRSMIHEGVQVAVFGLDCNVEHHQERTSEVLVQRIDSAGDLAPAIGEMLVRRVKSALHR